jgi:hypothetical protein
MARQNHVGGRVAFIIGVWARDGRRDSEHLNNYLKGIVSPRRWLWWCSAQAVALYRSGSDNKGRFLDEEGGSSAQLANFPSMMWIVPLKLELPEKDCAALSSTLSHHLSQLQGRQKKLVRLDL